MVPIAILGSVPVGYWWYLFGVITAPLLLLVVLRISDLHVQWVRWRSRHLFSYVRLFAEHDLEPLIFQVYGGEFVPDRVQLVATPGQPHPVKQTHYVRRALVVRPRRHSKHALVLGWFQ